MIELHPLRLTGPDDMPIAVDPLQIASVQPTNSVTLVKLIDGTVVSVNESYDTIANRLARGVALVRPMPMRVVEEDASPPLMP